MRPRPIIILAAPFCGSSWLAGVLSSLPGVYAAPQVFPYLADSVAELLDIFALSQDEHGDGLLRLVAELTEGTQDAAAIAAAREWLALRRGQPVSALLNELAARVAPKRLLLPDSEAPLRPIDLRRILRSDPDADLIHLVRHPWRQGCRFAAWLRERIFVPTDFRDYSQFPPLPDPQIPWLRANDNIERLLAQWPAERVHRISSESLDTDFDRSIAALIKRLGLSGMPGDAAQWVFAQRGDRSAPGGLEADVWAELPEADEALSEQVSLDTPLPWRPDGQGFADEVRALAQRYGYQ